MRVQWQARLGFLLISTRRPASTGMFFAQPQKFYQLLQTVKNETTALNLVVKGFFLQASIPPMISILFAKKDLSRFSVESFFCLTVPKNFLGEPFGISEKFWYRKILCIWGGEGRDYHEFPSKKFCLTVSENFVGELFCVSEELWYRKFLGTREGAGITISRQLFSHSAEKIRRGTLRCFREVLVSKIIYS